MLPLKIVIHKNVLNLFMNIARLSDSVEFEIAKRQLAMKESHENSWFNYVKELLDLYGLPLIFELFENRPQKLAWKHLLNNSVNFAIEAEWKSDIEQKSSLKYVNPETLGVGKCHPNWSTVRNNLADSRRAQLKCKLLTGSYILQGNRAVFNQYQVDPACKLCSAAPETRQHFLAECPVFESERDSFMQKMCNNSLLQDCRFHDPDIFTRLVLDSSAVFDYNATNQSVISQVELHAREYIQESPG